MYNNLKDVFFDSKYHVGKGIAVYDTSLEKTTFDSLQDINAVANSEVAMNEIVMSEKILNAIAGSMLAINTLGASEIAMIAITNSAMAKEIFEKANAPIDLTSSPGAKLFVAGNMQEGYFGEVPASELITGTALASAAGISAGTSQFSDIGWLKFAWKGNIQFVAKKPLRHSISWNNINTAGCVFGTKTVVIGGLTYKVRLMRAGIVDPMTAASGASNHGSEWNRLMLPIHIEAKDKSWAYPNNVEAGIPYWGVDFTDEDLHTHNSFGSGSYSWCQETLSTDATRRLSRGYTGVSNSNIGTSSTAGSSFGWRPVLELV